MKDEIDEEPKNSNFKKKKTAGKIFQKSVESALNDSS
jgi:hypothetical protein